MIGPLKSPRGFTIIELLTVVGIIGVLAAVAIPQYSGYKARAVDSGMQSVLVNARLAMEAYFLDFNTYTDDESALESYAYRPSDGITLDAKDSSTIDFTLCSCASGGTRPCYEFNLLVGRTLGADAGCP